MEERTGSLGQTSGILRNSRGKGKPHSSRSASNRRKAPLATLRNGSGRVSNPDQDTSKTKDISSELDLKATDESTTLSLPQVAILPPHVRSQSAPAWSNMLPLEDRPLGPSKSVSSTSRNCAVSGPHSLRPADLVPLTTRRQHGGIVEIYLSSPRNLEDLKQACFHPAVNGRLQTRATGTCEDQVLSGIVASFSYRWASVEAKKGWLARHHQLNSAQNFLRAYGSGGDSSLGSGPAATCYSDPPSEQGGSNQVPASLKRAGPGANDEEDNGGRRKAPGTRQNTDVDTITLVACPFWKLDPQRYSANNTLEKNYRRCASMYLREIPHLK